MTWITALLLSWLWAQVLPWVGPGTPHTTGGASTPTFVSESETAWARTTATTLDTASTAVQNGDTLVAVMIGEDSGTVPTLTASTTVGSTSAWTVQQTQNTGSNTIVVLSTATASATGNITVRVTRGGGGTTGFGMNLLVFRSTGGIGASSKTNGSGAPSLNLTTTKASSAIVVGVGDWAAVDGTTRTWRTGAGTASEVSYFRDSAAYTIYAAYYANAGAIGTYAVGLTAPAGQTFAMAAVEVKGP